MTADPFAAEMDDLGPPDPDDGSAAEPAPSYVSHGSYSMTPAGLTVETKDKVSTLAAAFEVLGRARDPSGNGWARVLRWRDPDGRSHRHAVPDASLFGEPAALCADLAARGLDIRGRPAAVIDYLRGADTPIRIVLVDRTGWHDLADGPAFVLPGDTIGPAGNERVLLDSPAVDTYGAWGTLENWQAGVGGLVAGHARPVLAVSAALAGPLLALAEREGGGLNLFGASSAGKSTCLEAAASVWGRGTTPGFVRSWRATANGLEGAAASATDTILVLDELGMVDGREAAASVYMLGNGAGKSRARRDGSLRDPKTWRLLILSSGELPMAAKMAEDRGRRAFAGQQVRMLDIPADAGRGFGAFDAAGQGSDAGQLADAIKKAARTCYGTAGPAFVHRIVAEGSQAVGRRAATLADTFVEEHVPAGADGQVTRAAARLGLIAAAGELATEWGITPWWKGHAAGAAARALDAWIAGRGGVGAAEARDAVAQVRRFIEQHGESRFQPASGVGFDRPVSNRAGYRKGEGAERRWLILPETWKAEVCAGLDPTATARALAERGFLLRDEAGGKLQRAERTPDGVQRVYVLTPAVLTGEPGSASPG